MPDVKEVYEMVTKQKPSDPSALERQHTRQVRTMRNRKLGAFAVAAAIGAVAVVVILASLDGQDTTGRTVGTDPEPTAMAEEIATGFVETFGAFDGERAITYLADDAYLEMDATTPEEVPVFTSFLEAQGYKQILVDTCRVTSSSSFATEVRCPFDWHAIGSDEIGLGPYPGYWDLTVRDGEITVVWLYWDIKRFSPQMWEPFRDWVSENHPKDYEVMYVDGGGNFSLTKESIQLWGRHVRGYVQHVLESQGPS